MADPPFDEGADHDTVADELDAGVALTPCGAVGAVAVASADAAK